MRNRTRLRRTGIGLAALAAAALVLAQGVVFRDAKENMVLRGLSSWKTTRVDDNTLRIQGSGAPLVGQWKSQGLEVRAKTLDGKAQRGADKAFRLSQANLGGVESVTLDQAQRKTLLTCSVAAFTAMDADSGKAVLTGGVKMVSTAADGAVVTLTGSKAEFALILGGTAKWPIRTGTIEGPVTIAMTSKDAQGRPTKMSATGARLTYDDASKKMRLTGGVTITGEDSVMGGEAKGREAVLTLDQDHKPIDVELSGDPGETIVREAKKP